MNILITGATGLVGSNATKAFLAAGHNVTALCRPSANTSVLKNYGSSSLKICEGDILDVLSLENALNGIDVVLHTAAMVSFSPKERDAMYKINVEGTANVVNACLDANIKKLCFVSSVAALGRPSQERSTVTTHIDESKKWEESSLNSHYAKSKYQAECEVWRGEAEGLSVAVVNPSVILGEGDWNRSSSQLFKYVYDQNKFYTEGFLNYVDIKDVVHVLLQLVEGKIMGERFILSAGSISFKSFFDKIADAFQKPKPTILVGKMLSAIIWRVEALRSFLTGSTPLITKETAKTARTHIHFDGSKITRTLPLFQYQTIDASIERVCHYFKTKNSASTK
jgi:dihydroflavonol-4-reductase